MQEYKNIGVYGICRKHPNGDESVFRSVATETFDYNRRSEWKKFTLYIDEANVGTVCERTNLQKLINDAISGKVDHIFICSLWDFWHNAQALKETMDLLKSFSVPVGITFPKGKTRHCTTMLSSLNDGYNRLIYEMLQVQKMDVDLMFLATNYSETSKVVKRTIFQEHIDQNILNGYFFDNYITARNKDWDDLKNEVGLSDTDVFEIKEGGYPSPEGIDQIIEWGMRNIISHYLI